MRVESNWRRQCCTDEEVVNTSRESVTVVRAYQSNKKKFIKFKLSEIFLCFALLGGHHTTFNQMYVVRRTTKSKRNIRIKVSWVSLVNAWWMKFGVENRENDQIESNLLDSRIFFSLSSALLASAVCVTVWVRVHTLANRVTTVGMNIIFFSRDTRRLLGRSCDKWLRVNCGRGSEREEIVENPL